MKTMSRLKTSLSTSENKSAVKKLLEDLSKNLERFEEELESRRSSKEDDSWMIEGMFSALDINLGVFLHYIRQIGLARQLVSDKPALRQLWETVMRRPQSLEVCRASMEKETSVENLPDVLSDSGESEEEEVQKQDNSLQTKERKKMKRKKQHEDRSWYSLW